MDGRTTGSEPKKETGCRFRFFFSVFCCFVTVITHQSLRNSAKAIQTLNVIDDKPAERPKNASILSLESVPKNERSLTGEGLLRNATRPPIESIVQEWNITGDPQFLLDFAVLGFAKCGTSTMMTWLGQHPQAQCFPREVCDLLRNQPATLIRRLYNELPEGNYKRGYKCPSEIGQTHVRTQLTKYWAQTPILVGIRHPVNWFESFYNFRANNYNVIPPANKLIGRCTKEKKGVCTNRALFHVDLASLRKTNMTAPEEVEMIQRHPKQLKNMNSRLANKLFLFTTDQLADTNETRSELFRKDVQHFIGFAQEMPPMVHVKPGIKWNNEKQAIKDSKKINICDPEYDKLRGVLMGIARPASVWIRKYFIESDEVVVSSPDYFKENLETWMHDPCDSRPANAE